jgi:hypothetical protein
MSGNIKSNEMQQLQTIEEMKIVHDTDYEIGQHNIRPWG